MNEIGPPAETAIPRQPSQASPVPSAPDFAPAGRATARDVLVHVFYHRKLLRGCILFGLLVGLLGASLAHTYFTADSLVLVLIGSESTSAQDSPGISPTVLSIDGLKAVQSEIQIIDSDDVLSAAVKQVGAGVIYPWLRRPRWFGLLPPRNAATDEGLAVQMMRSELRVEADPGSSVIRIAFANPDRATAIRAVQAVLDAYLTQRRTIYASTNAAFVSREIARYREALAKLDTQIQDLRSHYGVLDMAQDTVLATDRLDGIVQRQNQVRERRVAVQTEITAVKANLAGQPPIVLDFRETTNNTGNDEARNTLVRLEQQRTYLTSQFNPDWPSIAEVNKQIASARAQMGPHEKNLYFTERQIRNPALEVLNNRLASLEIENEALGQQLVELDGQYAQAEGRVNSLRDADGQLHELIMTRDVTESVYRQMAQRQPAAVFQDHIVDERNANLRVVQMATAPVIGRSMAVSYVVGGFCLGLLLGAAAVALATVLREVYILPAEAERELLLPALASLDSRGSKVHVDDRPALADLGMLLQQVTVDGRPLASLQIIGTADGDNRVAIVRELAAELATGQERRTLILDLEEGGSAYAAALGPAPDVSVPERSLPIQVTGTRTPRLWVGIGTTQPVLSDWGGPVSRTRRILDELNRDFDLLLLVAPADPTGHAVRRFAAVAMHLCGTIRAAGGNLLGFIFDGRKYYVPNWLYRWV
jgi:uncharacterized protein involved in exopolysaccharide biosynthesis